MGGVYIELKQYRFALAAYQQAIRVAPHETLALWSTFRLGMVSTPTDLE